MSNRDECWRFGVLMPSGTSLGVAWSRSYNSLFSPGLGGARSVGIVSVAPGAGTCCTNSIVSKDHCDGNSPIRGTEQTHRTTGTDDNTWREMVGRTRWSAAATNVVHCTSSGGRTTKRGRLRRLQASEGLARGQGIGQRRLT